MISNKNKVMDDKNLTHRENNDHKSYVESIYTEQSSITASILRRIASTLESAKTEET